MKTHLYRINEGRVVAGVCTGLAHYFQVDVTFIRALFIIAAFLHGFGIIAYLVLWVVLPEEGDQQPLKVTPPSLSNTTIGIVTVAVGLLLLLANVLPSLGFQITWPILLIVIGGLLLIRSSQK